MAKSRIVRAIKWLGGKPRGVSRRHPNGGRVTSNRRIGGATWIAWMHKGWYCRGPTRGDGGEGDGPFSSRGGLEP